MYSDFNNLKDVLFCLYFQWATTTNGFYSFICIFCHCRLWESMVFKRWFFKGKLKFLFFFAKYLIKQQVKHDLYFFSLFYAQNRSTHCHASNYFLFATTWFHTILLNNDIKYISLRINNLHTLHKVNAQRCYYNRSPTPTVFSYATELMHNI